MIDNIETIKLQLVETVVLLSVVILFFAIWVAITKFFEIDFTRNDFNLYLFFSLHRKINQIVIILK